jgi:hypothetical protein
MTPDKPTSLYSKKSGSRMRLLVCRISFMTPDKTTLLWSEQPFMNTPRLKKEVAWLHNEPATVLE